MSPTPPDDQQTPDTPQPTYEEARDQLIAVVRELESGNVALSKSMELWERGERLAAICQRWLDGAKETIERAKRPSARTERDEVAE